MEFTAKEISVLIQAEIEGNPDSKVDRLSKIEEGEPGSLSFLSNPKYEHYIYVTRASIVIVDKSFEPNQPVTPTLLRVDNPRAAFAVLLEAYNQIKQNKKGISPLAFIHPSAKIGQDVYIGEFSYIGENVLIGDRVKVYPQVYIGDHSSIGEATVIYAGVKIYHEVVIGRNCMLHSGAVIGSDGFGFSTDEAGNYLKIPQTGNVILEDNIEIGANTTIDRATLGSTRLGKGVKLDNLVQIAHNVSVGSNTVMAAQSGIAGSSTVGSNCQIAGQVGIVGHLSIADGVRIAGQSGIEGSINEPGAVIMGSPGFDIRKYQRAYVHFRKLEELVKRIEELEKKAAK